MLSENLINEIDKEVVSRLEIYETYNENDISNVLENLVFKGLVDCEDEELCDEVIFYLYNYI